MIHEIYPERMDNQYRQTAPDENSRVMLFQESKALVKMEDQDTRVISWPLYRDWEDKIERSVYLFAIDGRTYFLGSLRETVRQEKPEEGFLWMPWNEIRDVSPVAEAMAGMTALHLYQWYETTQFCGRCGGRLEHDGRERMMRCPVCGNMIFPKIAPAIVVAVTDGTRLLLTKYAGKINAQYALVAGFVEIGETAEECVRRELMEEVGIHIKNLRYYGSQPWGFPGNLMMGFTAELDGSPAIHLDRHELGLAKWLLPEEIPEIADYSSLTREMIRRFKNGVLFK